MWNQMCENVWNQSIIMTFALWATKISPGKMNKETKMETSVMDDRSKI